MQDNSPPQPKTNEKAGLADKITAAVLAALIAGWLIAYVFFAARAWLGVD